MYQVLGWVCAKAIHDARLLDLPFSTPLCHTLLDRPLERADLALICPDVYKTLQKLEGIVEQKKAILKDASMSADAKVPSCLSLVWGGRMLMCGKECCRPDGLRFLMCAPCTCAGRRTLSKR